MWHIIFFQKRRGQFGKNWNIFLSDYEKNTFEIWMNSDMISSFLYFRHRRSKSLSNKSVAETITHSCIVLTFRIKLDLPLKDYNRQFNETVRLLLQIFKRTDLVTISFVQCVFIIRYAFHLLIYCYWNSKIWTIKT